MERDRTQLVVQTMKELNTQYNTYNRRASASQPPLAVNRVKVTFKDEPGEGSGVARSFYTAIAEVNPIIVIFTLFIFFVRFIELHLLLFKVY